MDELYSGSGSEYYEESDLDYDDRIDGRDDASDEESDDAYERGALAGLSGADLGGLSDLGGLV